MQLHTGKKQYACSECNRKSSTKANFNKHMRIHVREAVYLSILRKSVCRKEYFDEHMKIHNDRNAIRLSGLQQSVHTKIYFSSSSEKAHR